jgi:valyl-tRNA synthetase
MFPENWIKTYYAWLDNIRDWCISRQIWWGHRIPAWTCAACSGLIVAEQAPPTCPQCGAPHLLQDEDVLDTWFSSALWPFSTLGWPDDTPDLRMFYPTTVLVTGFDILFFWVARMIMMGQAMMGQVPFRAVYLHALVRDRHGKKMSKSSGNVIDPIEMIGRYGADALRFTLTAIAAMGRDIRLSEDRIEGYRHFINKLWNAARFVLLNLGAAAPRAVDPASVQALHHCWLLHRLEEVKARTAEDLAGYRFNDAAQGLYRFLWGEFCDWYLELIKPDLRADGPARETALYVLWLALREILVLLHPVTPFVTAEIWSVTPCAGEPADLALEPYPPARPGCLKPEAAADMDWVQQVIGAIRTIRAELNIAPSYRLEVLLRPADARQQGLLIACRDMISTLARAGSLEMDAGDETPGASASAVVQGCEVIVRLSGAVDFASELIRLDREIGKIVKELTMLEKKLNNEHFVGRAPADVVRREKERASELALARDKLSALRERFRSAMPKC